MNFQFFSFYKIFNYRLTAQQNFAVGNCQRLKTEEVGGGKWPKIRTKTRTRTRTDPSLDNANEEDQKGAFLSFFQKWPKVAQKSMSEKDEKIGKEKKLN